MIRKNVTSSKTTNKTREIKPLYNATALTKNSKKELWVVFEQGKPSTGLVFTSILSRDLVRRTTAKLLNVPYENVRSRRLISYRKLISK